MSTEKVSLLKMKISINFKCNPIFQIVNYQDELIDEIKVYKDINKTKDRKNIVEIGSIFSSCNIFSNEPSWIAEMILLKKDLTKDLFIQKSKELYKFAFELVNSGKEIFINNVNKLTIPDDEYFSTRYLNKINKQFWQEIKIDDFKDIINKKVQKFCDELLETSFMDASKYKWLFKLHFYDEKLDTYIRSLKVLNIKNNNIYFNCQKDYEQTIKTISSFFIDQMAELFFSYLESEKNEKNIKPMDIKPN